jgi:uncharacterized protein (DUF486 family)
MPSLPVVAQTTLLLTASHVFMSFGVLYRREPLKPDFPWAGLRPVAAVHFMFTSG